MWLPEDLSSVPASHKLFAHTCNSRRSIIPTNIHLKKSTNSSLRNLRKSEQSSSQRESRGPSWVKCWFIGLRQEFYYVVQAGLLSAEIAFPKFIPSREFIKLAFPGPFPPHLCECGISAGIHSSGPDVRAHICSASGGDSWWLPTIWETPSLRGKVEMVKKIAPLLGF